LSLDVDFSLFIDRKDGALFGSDDYTFCLDQIFEHEDGLIELFDGSKCEGVVEGEAFMIVCVFGDVLLMK
jgi:hypothetical protein